MPKERSRRPQTFSPTDLPQKYLKLTFEGDSSDDEFEMVVPVLLRKRKKEKEVKRSFTATSHPFPFTLSTNYPSDTDGWTKMTSDLYSWMQQHASEHATDEWRWAVNFFWICYVGSSPGFPFEWGKTTVAWDYKIVPLRGEFMFMRANCRTFGDCVPEETGATLIARLVDWLKLKEKWIKDGVDAREFRRISGNE